MKKFIYIIIFSLVLTGCGSNLGGVVSNDKYNEVKKIKTQIDEVFTLQYNNNKTGEIEFFKITEKEWREITKENKQPPKDGYTYIGGSGYSPVYEETIPELNDNEYLILEHSTTSLQILIKLPNENIKIVTEL